MSNDMTIAEFCDKRRACQPGLDWAIAHCATMLDVWQTARPEWLVWVATRPGVLTARELRLFGVWSARQVGYLMTDPRSLAALDVAERHVHGQASDEELAAACGAAWDATAATAAGGAYAAAYAAAYCAADAASAAADAAADADAVARAAQAAWLRENTKPNFTRRTAE